jgi:hypothetical protein
VQSHGNAVLAELNAIGHFTVTFPFHCSVGTVQLDCMGVTIANYSTGALVRRRDTANTPGLEQEDPLTKRSLAGQPD